jgi:hypothetical protein
VSARLAAVVTCAGVLLGARLGTAQDMPPRLLTSDYSVDMFQGPVVTSTRVTGLAGAYVAIAEGVDGTTQNPAAPAIRTPWSRDHFDYDLGFGFTSPSTLANTDFFNRGGNTRLPSTGDQRFFALNLAFVLQFGTWGFALSADAQSFKLEKDPRPGDAAADDPLTAQFVHSHSPQIARTFADGQLALGVGLRSTGLSVSRGETQLFSNSGSGWEAGMIWRPNWQPFRVGAAFRSAIRTRANIPDRERVGFDGENTWIDFDADGSGPGMLERLYLPKRVATPWDLNFGVAIQIGKRPFNPRWLDPNELVERTGRYLRWRARERERKRAVLVKRAEQQGGADAAALAAIDAELRTEAALDELHAERSEIRVNTYLRKRYLDLSRSYLLIAASMVVTGPAERGVGVEDFLQQYDIASGETVVISPRLGLETELVPNWLKTRGGTYLEPTRFEGAGSSSRLHGTLGFEARLFPWTVFGLFEEGTNWRVSGVVDVAARYFGWGVSLGVWR